MAVTGTQNVRDVVTAAARKAGILDIGEEFAAENMTAAVGELFRMLKAWQAAPGMWTRATQTVALVSATGSYALAAPARPVRVLRAWFRRGGLDMPMQQLTQQEYDDMPNKAAVGLPSTWFYDRLAAAGTLYLWPVLATVAGEQVILRIEREIEDVTNPNDPLDAPAEWYDAIVHGLAARMVDDYGVTGRQAERVHALAALSLEKARAFEMDESVFLAAPI
jgi:hypothetical protein